MRILPPAPSPGDRVSATLLRELIRYIRASTPIAGPGLKSRVSPNGTILSVAAKASKTAAAVDKGCWRIVAETISVETGGETATTTVHYIDRQYFQVGGTLFEGADRTTMESLVEANTPFIAAKIYATGGEPSAHLVGYADFASLQADSLDRTFSLIPLYELEPPPEPEEGEEEDDAAPTKIAVKVDFRAMPLVQAFELPTEGGIA